MFKSVAPQVEKSEGLFTKLKDNIISITITEDRPKDDLKVLLREAKIFRKDIPSHSTWMFDWTFSCEGVYASIQCLNPLAPKAVINLVTRVCKKGVQTRTVVTVTKFHVEKCVGYLYDNKVNPTESPLIGMDEIMIRAVNHKIKSYNLIYFIFSLKQAWMLNRF